MSDYVPKRFRNIPLPQRMAESHRKPPRTWRWIRCSAIAPKTIFGVGDTSGMVKYLKEIFKETGIHIRTDLLASRKYIATRKSGAVEERDKEYEIEQIRFVDIAQSVGAQSVGNEAPVDSIVKTEIRHEFTFAVSGDVNLDEVNFSLMMAKPFEFVEMDYAFFALTPGLSRKETVHLMNFTATHAQQPKAPKKQKVPKHASLQGWSDLHSMYPHVLQSVGRMSRNPGKTTPYVYIDASRGKLRGKP